MKNQSRANKRKTSVIQLWVNNWYKMKTKFNPHRTWILESTLIIKWSASSNLGWSENWWKAAKNHHLLQCQWECNKNKVSRWSHLDLDISIQTITKPQWPQSKESFKNLYSQTWIPEVETKQKSLLTHKQVQTEQRHTTQWEVIITK